MRSIALGVLSSLFAWAASGCTADDCESVDALQQRLDTAAAGETVSAAACTFRGSLVVSSGVRLEGAGPEATRFVGTADARAVTLEPGAEVPTALGNLSIESDGCAAIVATGAGSVEVTDVEVRASRGVGVAVEGVDAVTLDGVLVRGPVTPETADEIVPPSPPFVCGGAATATHGIALVSAETAELSDVRVEGFAAFGALFVESAIHWDGGGVSTNLGAGLEVWGGEATLTGLTLATTRDGSGAVESFGGVFGGGARVTSRGLAVEEGDGFGLFHDGVTAIHEDLSAENNGFAGLWAQGMTTLDLLGATVLSDNGFAGVAALGSSQVTLRGATIGGTRENVRISGVRTVRAGDGVHLVDSDGVLEDVTLLGNTRVGVLLDLAGGSTDRIDLTRVSVEGSGEALGAIAQNGTLRAGWDMDVDRRGDTLANDQAFAGMLSIADAVGPVCFPPLDRLDSTGLGALIGP